MALILKAIGGIAALILLVITLLGSIVTLGGFLLAAIKFLIVVIFLAVVTMIAFSILRDRSRKRREVDDL
jgi:predicted lipid-binding transport protein (Tim44 family)